MRHNLHVSKDAENAVTELDRIGLKFRPTIRRGPMILLAIRFAASRAADFVKWIKSSR